MMHAFHFSILQTVMTVLNPFDSQNNNNAGFFSSLKKYKKERNFKKEKGF